MPFYYFFFTFLFRYIVCLFCIDIFLVEIEIKIYNLVNHLIMGCENKNGIFRSSISDNNIDSYDFSILLSVEKRG